MGCLQAASSSVGRNAHLLLNVPPDRRGLIHGNDIRSLKAMRAILDSTFSRSLSLNSNIQCSPTGNGDPKAMVDDDPRTYWSASVCKPAIDLELTRVSSFDRLLLQENFRNGQRVEEFVLEADSSGSWAEVVRGSTIGYKRLLRFPLVSTQHVRLRILQSRGGAEISTIGLYRSAPCEP